MTSVNLNSNGDYWQARWTDADGRPRGRSLGRKDDVSRRQALAACREIAAEQARKPATRNVTRAATLGDWLADFERLTPTYSAATRKLYEQVGAMLTDHFGPDRRLDRITRRDAADWRAAITKQTYTRDAAGKRKRTRSESTIRKHIRAAKVIFATAVRCEAIAANPFEAEAGAPIQTDRDWHYLTPAVLQDVLSACPSQPWRSLFCLCRLAGLRLGEALRLTWQDVDHAKGIITVRHEGDQTTKRRRRSVPMTPDLAAELVRALEAAEEGQARVCPLPRLNLYRQAESIVKRAGYEPWAKMFHTLRKNCESDWLAKYPVMAVCDWFGHNPSVAAKHYHKPGEDLIAQVTGQQVEADNPAQLRARIAELEAQLNQHRAKL